MKKEEYNMWIRLVIVGFFSLTALALMSFQSIEIVNAIMNLIHNKN